MNIAKIRTPSREMYKFVQTVLFDKGYKWNGDYTTILHDNEDYMSIFMEDSKYITRCSRESFFEHDTKSVPEIFLEDLVPGITALFEMVKDDSYETHKAPIGSFVYQTTHEFEASSVPAVRIIGIKPLLDEKGISKALMYKENMKEIPFPKKPVSAPSMFLESLPLKNSEVKIPLAGRTIPVGTKCMWKDMEVTVACYRSDHLGECLILRPDAGNALRMYVPMNNGDWENEFGEKITVDSSIGKFWCVCMGDLKVLPQEGTEGIWHQLQKADIQEYKRGSLSLDDVKELFIRHVPVDEPLTQFSEELSTIHTPATEVKLVDIEDIL